jgi:hypothetical protein
VREIDAGAALAVLGELTLFLPAPGDLIRDTVSGSYSGTEATAGITLPACGTSLVAGAGTAGMQQATCTTSLRVGFPSSGRAARAGLTGGTPGPIS